MKYSVCVGTKLYCYVEQDRASHSARTDFDKIGMGSQTPAVWELCIFEVKGESSSPVQWSSPQIVLLLTPNN